MENSPYRHQLNDMYLLFQLEKLSKSYDELCRMMDIIELETDQTDKNVDTRCCKRIIKISQDYLEELDTDIAKKYTSIDYELLKCAQIYYQSVKDMVNEFIEIYQLRLKHWLNQDISSGINHLEDVMFGMDNCSKRYIGIVRECAFIYQDIKNDLDNKKDLLLKEKKYLGVVKKYLDYQFRPLSDWSYFAQKRNESEYNELIMNLWETAKKADEISEAILSDFDFDLIQDMQLMLSRMAGHLRLLAEYNNFLKEPVKQNDEQLSSKEKEYLGVLLQTNDIISSMNSKISVYEQAIDYALDKPSIAT